MDRAFVPERFFGDDAMAANNVIWLGTAAVVLTSIVLLSKGVYYRRLLFPETPATGYDTPNIEPLWDFKWSETEPQKLRPFKPVYNITMALKADTPSELIIIDKNYLDRVNLRRELIREQGSTVHGCLNGGEDAVREAYQYLLADYLPTRFPSMFELSADKKTFHNLVTGREFPTEHKSSDLGAALRILGETVEDDMFILRETPDGHFTDAFVCCFPAGFDGSEKLGKLLKDVHGPVPSYEKIGASMEKFFKKLEVGKSVKRSNWSMQTNAVLFQCQPHATPEHTRVEEKEDFNIHETHARMELQTLTRLPRTRSILFSFKTYLYPLQEIQKEGLGPDLADAIEGLRAGNAPGMWVYKGGAKWSARVCDHLRA